MIFSAKTFLNGIELLFIPLNDFDKLPHLLNIKPTRLTVTATNKIIASYK